LLLSFYPFRITAFSILALSIMSLIEIHSIMTVIMLCCVPFFIVMLNFVKLIVVMLSVVVSYFSLQK